jgi:hypothetical protein
MSFKSVAALAAFSLCAISGAYAQTAKPAMNNGSLSVRGVVSMGITVGGDELANPAYVNGNSQKLTAGGLINFKGGVEFPVAQDWTVQTTIAYHVDRVNASNGSITFQRFPLEGIAFYHVSPQFRVGAGLRAALSPKLSGSGVGTTYVSNTDYSTKLGFVVEGEYLFSPHFGVSVRGVSEKYGVGNATIDGSHGGVGLNYYF